MIFFNVIGLFHLLISLNNPLYSLSATTSVVISTVYIGSCKFNYHTITATKATGFTVYFSFRELLIMKTFFMEDFRSGNGYACRCLTQTLCDTFGQLLAS
jgi:hypothetical protein